jgi:hypothetical protein
MLILGVSSTVLLSQKSLSGNISQPKTHVTDIGTDNVTVDDVTGFAANDTILLIQMQGVKIYTEETTLDGYLADKYGEPGMHEFLIIESVNAGLITFTHKLINPYDIKGNIQIVRVPYCNSATVTGNLTCDPWSSTSQSGGVLAMIIGRTLKLNADIDLTGKGFAGGNSTTNSDVHCQNESPIYTFENYDQSYTNAGFKGEGIANFNSDNAPLSPGFLKGKGPTFNGGGGGDGKYSGGGGGAQRGVGGIGGSEASGCIPYLGGVGGIKAEVAVTLSDRIFLGGGGGASTTAPLTGTSAPGGNGGGIVIIVTDTIIGPGSIRSIGGDGGNATGAAGAGGGGAGGTIALSLNSYGQDSVKFYVSGGKGGDSFGTGGEGGGGGGGLLWISTDVTSKVKTFLKDGWRGAPGDPGNNPAGPGEKIVGFKAILNGFLFNSIRSSVTGNQTDSICSNLKPPKITGTIPVGGTGPYTYLWEKSNDQVTWIPLTNDADPTDYTPTIIEPSTVYYRRTITDSSIPTAITDISKPVKIIVHPFIQNNVIVANPDTICFHGDPQLLKQGIPDLIVPTTKYLKYVWQDSTVGGVWGTELPADNFKEFDPAPSGILTKDTWYRRTVKSGACIDKGAGSIAKITVLPKIDNNSFSQLNDTICFGGNTNLNTVAGPTGGLPTDYRYKWESASVSSTGPWSAVGSTSQSFDPDASVSLPVGDHFYRRIIFSGEQDACKDTTKPAVRKVWPVISNNSIKADQTIGYDSIPVRLTETSGGPLGGDGLKYIYLWVKDTLTFPSAPVGANGINNNEYQPPNLKLTISFRRIVNSSACSSTSNSVKINVDLPIINTITMANAALDIIYTGQTSSKLNGSTPTGGSGIPNDYTFKWYKSLTGGPLKSDWALISDSIRIDLFPGNLTETTWFRRDVSSPAVSARSTYQSNYLKVTVLPKITNVGITANESVCYGRRPLQLKGSDLLTGGDGKYGFTWQDSSSLHTWQNITNYVKVDSANFKPPSLIIDTWYKRIVYSGKNDCGVEVSNAVFIKVNPLPEIPDAGSDTIIYSIEKIYHMNAHKPLSGETGVWDILKNGTSSFDDTSSYNTTVRNLTVGENSFLWTVSKDQCKLADSVNIQLLADFIPQGFSPNGDAWNNTFVIEGLNQDDNYIDLSIVNGAGTEVFKTSNRDPQIWTDWNGRNSKGADLSEGTYYYMLKITSKTNGQVFKRSGFIVLKRY